VGPRAGLDGCEKSRPPPAGIRSPDRPNDILPPLISLHVSSPTRATLRGDTAKVCTKAGNIKLKEDPFLQTQ